MLLNICGLFVCFLNITPLPSGTAVPFCRQYSGYVYVMACALPWKKRRLVCNQNRFATCFVVLCWMPLN